MNKNHFEYLRISVTDRCNLRCQYCMPSDGVPKMTHESILRYEEIRQIIEAVSLEGIFRIRITGGEPLIRKGLPGFISSIRNIPGISDLSLTTNGHFLEELAPTLFESGIHRLNISLDSLREDAYSEITRGGKLNQVLSGIKAAQRAGFSPIKINVVLLPGINDSEIIPFAEFADTNGFHVRFIERMPFTNSPLNDRFISQTHIMEILSSIYVLTPDPGNYGGGPAIMYQLGNGQGKIGFISPRTQPYCSTCTRLRLTASGDLMSCLDSRDKISVRGLSIPELRQVIRTLALEKMQKNQRCPTFLEAPCQSLSKIGG